MVIGNYMVILKALYFFVPAYFANMAPVFATKIFGSKLSQPIWEKGLGKNKTWRGLISAIVIGIAFIYLQQYLFNSVEFFKNISLLDYNKINLPLYGFLLSFGAILGDSVKSYFKRKQNLPPGSQWFPWDQLDFVIGGIIFISFVYQPSFFVIFILIVISPVLHILSNQLGFYLGIKKVKW